MLGTVCLCHTIRMERSQTKSNHVLPLLGAVLMIVGVYPWLSLFFGYLSFSQGNYTPPTPEVDSGTVLFGQLAMPISLILLIAALIICTVSILKGTSLRWLALTSLGLFAVTFILVFWTYYTGDCC